MANVSRFTDDDGNVLVDFEGADFYTGSPWGTRMALPDEVLIPETRELLTITDRDGIRRDVNYLAQVLKNGALYHADPFNRSWIWYEAMGSGEADKRALVYGGTIALPQPLPRLGGPLLRTPKAQPVLAFDRHRFFESVTAETVSATNLPVYGAKIVLSGEGTAESRIGSLVAAASGSAQRVWMGIRPIRNGADNFDPVINLKDGTALLGSVTADSDAVSGEMVQYVFSGPSTYNIVQIDLKDATASDAHNLDYIGRYQVVLRYECTNPIKVRMFVSGGNPRGYYTEPAYLPASPGTVDPYTAGLIGELTIPWVGLDHNWAAADVGNTRIRLEVELLSGSGTINLDTLTLIPASRMLSLNDKFGTMDEFEFKTFPNDEVAARRTYDPGTGSYPVNVIDAAAQNFTVPREGGVLVVAATDPSNGQAKTDEITTLDMQLWRRWDLFNRQVAPDV